MSNIGVILSGCGVYDGSEIQETILTLYFLDKMGVSTTFISIDLDQKDVVNHQNHTMGSPESRHVLSESARLTRGNVRSASSVKSESLDGLIFPGGFGAVKNLCNFAQRGVDCTVHPDIERLILEMHETRKPQGFMCIAPVIAAKVLTHVELTVGTDAATSSAIEKMGCYHTPCLVDDIVFDRNHNILSTPAYMLGPSISKIALGIEKLTTKVVELSRAPICVT